MQDLFFIVVACVFFGLFVAYTAGCDRLSAVRRPLLGVGGHND